MSGKEIILSEFPKYPGFEAERHGVPIINALVPNEEIVDFLKAIDYGEITFSEVELFEYAVPRLAGSTVTPIFRVHHMGAESTQGKFDGRFVGKEYHGVPSPLLLLPSEDVVKRSSNE